ncbi:MAG: hypothetical protein ACPG8O_01130, partial [Alcanivorax nanhaiticus]
WLAWRELFHPAGLPEHEPGLLSLLYSRSSSQPVSSVTAIKRTAGPASDPKASLKKINSSNFYPFLSILKILKYTSLSIRHLRLIEGGHHD